MRFVKVQDEERSGQVAINQILRLPALKQKRTDTDMLS